MGCLDVVEIQAGRKQYPEIFVFNMGESAEKSAVSVNYTDLNTVSGSNLVKESNMAKLVPSEFRGKDGQDIELVDTV